MNHMNPAVGVCVCLSTDTSCSTFPFTANRMDVGDPDKDGSNNNNNSKQSWRALPVEISVDIDREVDYPAWYLGYRRFRRLGSSSAEYWADYLSYAALQESYVRYYKRTIVAGLQCLSFVSPIKWLKSRLKIRCWLHLMLVLLSHEICVVEFGISV